MKAELALPKIRKSTPVCLSSTGEPMNIVPFTARPFGVTAGGTAASCCCGSHDRPPSVERRSSMEWGEPSAHVTKRRSAKTSSVLFTSMIAGIR